MKKLLVLTVAALALLTALAGFASAAPGDVTDPQVLQDLAAVRRATARYHDVNVALADGYIRTPSCAQDSGLGGMGIHFVNPNRLKNPAINLREPEILLYVETEHGMKLIGIEYMLPSGPPEAPIPSPVPPAPVSFGWQGAASSYR